MENKINLWSKPHDGNKLSKEGDNMENKLT